MKQKHVTLAACLLAFGLTAQAQDGGISPDMLKKIQSSYQNTAADKALRNAMGGTSIKELALNQENQKALNTPLRWNQKASPTSSRLAVAGCLRD